MSVTPGPYFISAAKASTAKPPSNRVETTLSVENFMLPLPMPICRFMDGAQMRILCPYTSVSYTITLCYPKLNSLLSIAAPQRDGIPRLFRGEAHRGFDCKSGRD